MIKKGELYRILYRLVENMTDRRKLYNFFKKFLGVFNDDSEVINPDILPNNLGDIMDTTQNLIKSKYLPSYVDDVLEGYYIEGIFYKTRTGEPGSYVYSEPYEPETGKIYVDLNTEDTTTYRWSGSSYIILNEGCKNKIIILKVVSNEYSSESFNYTYDELLSMINDEKNNYIFYVDDKKSSVKSDYLLPVYDIKKHETYLEVCCTLVYSSYIKYRSYDYTKNNNFNSVGYGNTTIVVKEELADTAFDVYFPVGKQAVGKAGLKAYIDEYRIDTSIPETPTNTKMLSTKATIDYIDTKIKTYPANNIVLNSQLNPFIGEQNEANVIENNKDDVNNNTATDASKCHIEGANNKINNVSVSHIEGSSNQVNSTGIAHVEGWNNKLSGESAIHIEGAYVNINSAITGVKNAYENGAHIGGVHPVDRTNKEPFISDGIVRQIGCGSETVSEDAFIITKSGKIYIKNIGAFTGEESQEQSFKDIATVIDDIEYKATAASSNVDAIKTQIKTILQSINTIESNIDTINTSIEEHTNSISTNTTNISAEVTRAKKEEETITTKLNKEIEERKAADNTLTQSINKEIEDRNTAITTLTTNLSTETSERKAKDEELLTNINNEITNRENAISTETTARKEADTAITTKITTEETRAKNAENAISTKVTAIEEKIPNQASKDNQLADKEFVNSSISTATATFRGTFETLVELNAVTEADNNDYTFYKHKDDAGNTLFDKYCYDGMDWKYQYTLNNSSFTAAQWAAINSEVTKTSIEELTNKINNINVEPFIITITSDANGYHANKTANEIHNACKQNKTIILTSDDFNNTTLLVTNISYDNINFAISAYDTSFGDEINFEWSIYGENSDGHNVIYILLEENPYVLPRDIQPFVITLTESGNTYTKDKTYGEINNAITNKKDIYILFTDNVLYRVNDMLSTIDESNSGAISLNFEKINPSADTIIYQLAVVVVNGSETMSLNSRTQNTPTIDTSIPTSPNDNCVPSTKLVNDTYIPKSNIDKDIPDTFYQNHVVSSNLLKVYIRDKINIYYDTGVGSTILNAIKYNNAPGIYSHAEGDTTTAKGRGSHAEGVYTTTSTVFGSHAEGKNNIGYSNSIHEVGIGNNSDNKKNAHTITDDGKHYIPNVGNYTGTETDLTNIKDLATIINNYESRITALETALANVQSQLESI